MLTVRVPDKRFSQSVVPVKDIDIQANGDEQLGLVNQSGVSSLGPTDGNESTTSAKTCTEKKERTSQ
jgi:hypothetical protein